MKLQVKSSQVNLIVVIMMHLCPYHSVFLEINILKEKSGLFIYCWTCLLVYVEIVKDVVEWKKKNLIKKVSIRVVQLLVIDCTCFSFILSKIDRIKVDFGYVVMLVTPLF